MCGDGPEHGPDVGVGLLEPDGEPLKHGVEGEGQHSEEVPGDNDDDDGDDISVCDDDDDLQAVVLGPKDSTLTL